MSDADHNSKFNPRAFGGNAVGILPRKNSKNYKSNISENSTDYHFADRFCLFDAFFEKPSAFMVADSAEHPVQPDTTVNVLFVQILSQSYPSSFNACRSIFPHQHLTALGPTASGPPSSSDGVLTSSAFATFSASSWERWNSSSHSSSHDLSLERAISESSKKITVQFVNAARYKWETIY